jgi:inner membrane protein
VSSFVGHGLTGLTAMLAAPPRGRARQAALGAWLTVIALAPDVDYLVRLARVRITHSLAVLALPALTVLALAVGGVRGRALAVRAGQATGAGVAHVVLDVLVGVTPLPLLWPLSARTYRLPFGLLPAAGRLDLHRAILYRNVLVEVACLAPVCAAVILIARGRARAPVLIALAVAAAGAMTLAATLPR